MESFSNTIITITSKINNITLFDLINDKILNEKQRVILKMTFGIGFNRKYNESEIATHLNKNLLYVRRLKSMASRALVYKYSFYLKCKDSSSLAEKIISSSNYMLTAKDLNTKLVYKVVNSLNKRDKYIMFRLFSIFNDDNKDNVQDIINTLNITRDEISLISQQIIDKIVNLHLAEKKRVNKYISNIVI